ncbi:hypothetical protein Pf1_00015 [Flavobacterium columnare]|nr:hypothetical protein Pf1_00015 [Flavobacterium columnare]
MLEWLLNTSKYTNKDVVRQQREPLTKEGKCEKRQKYLLEEARQP